MEEEKYVKVEVYGMITIPGTFFEGFAEWYYLLHPRPIERDSWMSDDTYMFRVVSVRGKPHDIVVKGAFFINYHAAGKKIDIRDVSLQEHLDLFNLEDEKENK
jgi:hypothetical protein